MGNVNINPVSSVPDHRVAHSWPMRVEVHPAFQAVKVPEFGCTIHANRLSATFMALRNMPLITFPLFYGRAHIVRVYHIRE